MQFGIRTLDEAELRGKTVLCRVDMNQPVDRAAGTLKSINRIRACVPTIRELCERGAKVVLLAHQGSDIEYKNFYSTEPHAKVLSELLSCEVQWIDDVCGPAAREKIKALHERILQVNPGCELEVDGGIDPETSPLVKQAGANVLVAGSAVFRQSDRAAAIAAIRNA